jgi:hypothetical protein
MNNLETQATLWTTHNEDIYNVKKHYTENIKDEQHGPQQQYGGKPRLTHVFAKV